MKQERGGLDTLITEITSREGSLSVHVADQLEALIIQEQLASVKKCRRKIASAKPLVSAER